MPKTIWQKKMAARKIVVHTLSETKHAAIAEDHQTSAQANCAFQRRTMLEVALAIPNMAQIMATEAWESTCPLQARDIRSREMEMPSEIQIAVMARPRVVEGLLRSRLLAITPVMTLAATIVTGQARAGWPEAAQAIAT